MSIGKYRNKGVYWYKKGYVLPTYSCLHFIQFLLFDFSSMNYCIIFIKLIIYYKLNNYYYHYIL